MSFSLPSDFSQASLSGMAGAAPLPLKCCAFPPHSAIAQINSPDFSTASAGIAEPTVLVEQQDIVACANNGDFDTVLAHVRAGLSLDEGNARCSPREPSRCGSSTGSLPRYGYQQAQ
jgi:hypothetical protein